MRRGDVVFTPSLRHMPQPGLQEWTSAPKGELFVFILLGTMPKKEGQDFSVVKALDDLGWVRKAVQS